MASSIETFTQAVKQVISDEFPDLASGFRYPVRARVLALRDGRVDIQILDASSNPDPSCPPLPAVRIPAALIDIKKGDLIRVCFYYNDPLQAFIEDWA